MCHLTSAAATWATDPTSANPGRVIGSFARSRPGRCARGGPKSGGRSGGKWLGRSDLSDTATALFGCRLLRAHDQGMNTYSSIHVPFAQLPIEARVAFYFLSSSALEYHCYWPHTAAEIYADLERIWNAERLRVSDLQDEDRMSEILERKLPKGDPSERSFNRPGTMPRCWGPN
jgi:hypothetical protein